MNPDLNQKASRIELLILDVDGVLTDGRLYFGNEGESHKAFNSLDGHGLRLLMDNGINVAIITGRQSNIVKHRMGDLGVTQIYQGYRDKLPAFEQLLEDTGLQPEQIAYMGDDILDLPVMSRVGLSVSVPNGHVFAREHSDLVTQASGGRGAVRELCDFLLQAKGLLQDIQAAYLK